MTKRTRLLAASLLPFLTSLTLASCTSSSDGGGGDTTSSGGTSDTSSGSTTGASTGTTSSGNTTSTSTTAQTTGGSGSTGGTSSTSTASTSAGSTGTSGSTSSTSPSTGSSGGSSSTSGGSSSTSGGGSDSSGGSTSTSGGTTGGGGSFECNLPELPEANELTEVNQKLPDPFTFFDGTKVTTKEQWECRRKEILAMGAKYIYGPYPAEPDEVTGTVSGGNVTINVKVGDKTDTFSATISGSGEVIALELSGGIYPNPRKKLSFGSGFEGKIRTLFGFSEINPNVANGWMIDRVMDVLEQNPDSGHDPQKMMVSGCSGCGKGAFLAGVFSRVPLTVIVESGGGGAANLRQAEWFRHGDGQDGYQCIDQGNTVYPQSIDNLEDSGICGPWVTGAAQWLRQDPSKVYNLPFDQHLLLATIAPRYLVHFTNNHGVNSWCHLGGTCEALSGWAAKPVWKALGVPERMGFHMYSAGHCSNPAEAVSLAGEFFKRAFEGSTTAQTDVLDIMDNGVQQPVSEWKDMWIDWDMETVLE